jgi:hypothetical protein
VIETPELVALIVATGLIVAGMAAVAWNDLGTPQEPVGAARRVVEAVVPAAGVIILLGAVWVWAT